MRPLGMALSYLPGRRLFLANLDRRAARLDVIRRGESSAAPAVALNWSDQKPYFWSDQRPCLTGGSDPARGLGKGMDADGTRPERGRIPTCSAAAWHGRSPRS